MKEENKYLQAFLKKEKKLISEYMEGFSWEKTYMNWENVLGDFGIDTKNLFVEVIIDNENMTDCRSYLSWWPKGKIKECKALVVNEFVGNGYSCRYPAASIDSGFSSGQRDTLSFMWELRNNTNKIAALLFLASFHARIISSRKCFPKEEWPPYLVVSELTNLIWEKLNNNERSYKWHNACGNVLPINSEDWHFKITDVFSLTHYISIEHCQLLSKFQPVKVTFKQ